MKRRSSEGERERNKKRDGKAEHTHALRPESIFREGVTSLGLPKLTRLLANLKNLPLGEAVCQRANECCHPRCLYQLGQDPMEKREGSGSEGRGLFLKARLSGWLGIQTRQNQ